MQMDYSSVGLKSNCACLSQVKRYDFGPRGSGIWGKSIYAAGSRSGEWRSMVAKNAKRFRCCAGESKKQGVAASAIHSQVNGTVVLLEKTLATEEAAPVRRRTVDPENVASIILGGVPGDHLFPLTSRRAAPAVPIGGSYRLIDIPMSNCINSGIRKIFVMTQFNSSSLNCHISKAYSFLNGNFGYGFVEVLAATRTQEMNWFRGTADAIRQFSWILEDRKNRNIDYIIVVSGDQLYRMDFMDLIQKHVDSGADITISSVIVDESRASAYGILKVGIDGRVIKFQEKPEGIHLKAMKNDNNNFLGLHHQDSNKCSYIASMGVYVFKKVTLLELLTMVYPKENDFGTHILPLAVSAYNVQAYVFEDSWMDVGTIKSYFDVNLALTDQHSEFQFYDQRTPIFTSARFLPPTKIEKCKVVDSIISHGCLLYECSVQHSVVGIRSLIGYGAQLKDTVMLGASKYETEEEFALLGGDKVPIGVGQNSQIRNCIIDLNARIGKNVVITNKDGVEEADRPEEGFYIRSGIIIIAKNATITDGTVI